MQKLSVLVVIVALALTACSSASQHPASNNPAVLKSQAVVQKWIDASQQRNADALLSLYSAHPVWTECSGPVCHDYSPATWQENVRHDFTDSNFRIDVQSYFVTEYGYRAVVQLLYSDPRVGTVSSPTIAILQFDSDGKIDAETWYWAATE